MQLASQRPGRAPEDALHNRRCCLRFKHAVDKREYSGRECAGTLCTLTCGQLICDCGRLLGIRGTGKGRLLVEDNDRDEPTPTRLDLKPKPVRLLLPRELAPSGARAIGLCFCASRVSTLRKRQCGHTHGSGNDQRGTQPFSCSPAVQLREVFVVQSCQPLSHPGSFELDERFREKHRRERQPSGRRRRCLNPVAHKSRGRVVRRARNRLVNTTKQ